MNKQDLMKSIAEKAYDVGFGAKKHFATYDITEKAPGWIGFSALSFGIFSLAFSELSTKLSSTMFIILGVVGLYINFYDHNKREYEATGVALTKLFNELKRLYLKVKNLDETEDFSTYQNTLQDIENRYYSICISKQILFSSWYAHYKFFWESQISWVDEQLNFRFLRDKLPLTFTIFIFILLLSALFLSIGTLQFDCIVNLLKNEWFSP